MPQREIYRGLTGEKDFHYSENFGRFVIREFGSVYVSQRERKIKSKGSIITNKVIRISIPALSSAICIREFGFEELSVYYTQIELSSEDAVRLEKLEIILSQDSA